VVRGKIVETEEIPAYCAVALAGLGWLPDTLMTRSVVVRMRPRAPTELIEPFRRRLFLREGKALHDRLETWARQVLGSIAGTWPSMPDGVEDRAADVWEALIAVAIAAGGDWPGHATKAAVALVAEARDDTPSLGVRLLGDLRTVFKDYDSMPTAQILEQLHALEESPWSDLKGKPLDARGLAWHLRQYSIKVKVIRVGSRTPRGYERADLMDAWERYLPPSRPKSATSATFAPGPLEAAETLGFSVADDVADTADVADDPQHSGTGHVAGVAQHRPTGATKKARKTANVADVAPVADLQRDGEADIPCITCGAPLTAAEDATGQLLCNRCRNRDGHDRS
jgi:hypothetical protein